MNDEQLVPPALLKALCEGRCVLFIGSGVSQGEGLPSGAQIATTLCGDLKDYGATSAILEAVTQKPVHLARVATLYGQVFEDLSARQRICQIIEEATERAEALFHAYLPQLHSVDHIITTNWDTLIENALPSMDRVVIREDTDLRNVRPRWTNIYKIHGCVTSPASMLLDIRDQASFETERAHFAELVRTLLRQYTFLCIGYSLEDSNFQRQVAQTADESANSVPAHFFVSPDDAVVQEAAWKSAGFTHIQADARTFIEALTDAYGKREFSPNSARLPIEVMTDRTGVARSCNPFEMYDTEALAEARPDLFVQYFIRPLGYGSLLERQNAVVEGHRGSGKSMVFRYLSLYHEQERGQDLPFWGFYVKLESGFFDAIERTLEGDAEWARLFQHYLNLVIATGIIKNVVRAQAAGVFAFSDEDEQTIVHRVRQRLLRTSGEGYGDSLTELQEEMYGQLDLMRDNPEFECFHTSPRFIEAFLSELGAYVANMATKWWAVFLDEWDNLTAEQQKVATPRLHDRSGRLRYKVATKTLGFRAHKVDIVHDYAYLCVDHHLFDETRKAQYFDFLEHVGNKRLAVYGAELTDIRELLPASPRVPKHGHEYSGFERYAMLSGGLVREFLELAKDAVYCAFPEIGERCVPLHPVPPKWQNHVAKLHAAIHYNNTRACEYADHVAKLLHVIGAVFHAIDRVTAGQKEPRRPLSFEIRDFHSVSELSKGVLTDAIRERLLQTPEIPIQPRNPEEGVKEKNVLHRVLCPLFGLSVYERYTVPVPAETLESMWTQPHEAIRQLVRNYKKKGVEEYLPKPPGWLFDF